MAQIVLGLATSHTPMLALSADLWGSYAQRDAENPELAFPPDGLVMPYQEALAVVPPEVRARYRGPEVYPAQAAECQRALDALATSLREANPDITIVITDDQDEWFFEDNMPALAVYWGDTAPLRPRYMPPNIRDRAVADAITRGYGDVPMDVPVPSAFGRYLIEYLVEHDFDVSHVRDIKPAYGGRVARRYPTKNGELQYARETAPREQGLPHGVSFVVKRLFDNRPRPILPVFQNTCYPPNQPTPRRAFATGQAIAAAIREWSEPGRIAIVASGGLSHFVVDEELDRLVLDALAAKDDKALQTVPRHRLHSAASEALNWVALGGAMHDTALTMEL